MGLSHGGNGRRCVSLADLWKQTKEEEQGELRLTTPFSPCLSLCFISFSLFLSGRRLSFNVTLFLAGLFGIVGGGAPNFVGLGGILAALGVGLGE